MAVMAAGMHLALDLAGMRRPGQFLDRQRVHVGAQPDHRPRAAPVDDRDDAGPGDALVDLVHPDLAQPRRRSRPRSRGKSKASSGYWCRCRRQPFISSA
jgi:hypothetical protein